MPIVEYRPDYSGLGDLLTSEEVRAELTTAAHKGVEIARGLASAFTRTGAFRDSIHVEDGGTVDFVSDYGTVSRRACVMIVADSGDAETVEFGGRHRYSHGLNREGHHVLRDTAAILRGG